MTPERFRALQKAFDAAVDLSASEQTDYLRELTEADPELAEELARLLSRDAADGKKAPLNSVVSRVAASLNHTSTLQQGQSIGPYLVGEKIAQGGMGVVFKGHRNDAAFDQEVAIKVLGAVLHSDEATVRFRTERQILANLKHPCIAELYDGGTTGQGLPYLIMELIDGEPIDVWCDQRDMDIQARLEVFLKVCDAVTHAHANLIIHRDIKPANILVRADGMPKLLDFGIAKPLDSVLAENAAETRPDARAMTPEYASPEQILGQPITTATDVYGLGLLLHRLLVGRHPYDIRGKRPSEVEQTICEAPPTPPSRSLVTATPDSPMSAAEIVAHRASTPRRLQRMLVGDLDNIVLCALQKAPQRRYASVSALADDVRRYLNHEPVHARPDTLVYRTSRFLRRHWFGASFSAALLLLISAFAIHTAYQARLLRIERDAAEATTEYLVGMFRLADPRLTEPGYVLPDTVTVRDLLELGGRRVAELGDQPDVQARLLNAIGMAYQSIGEFEKARNFFQQALNLRQILGEHPVVIAESLAEQGWLYYQESQYRSAAAVLEQAIGLLEGGDPEHDLTRRDALVNLAMVRMSTGNLSAADELLARAREIERNSSGISESEIAVTLHNQAIVVWERGNYEQALTMEKRVVEIWERELHPDHPSLSAAYNFLGTLYLETGAPYAQTITLYERALAIDEIQFGSSHPDVARGLMDLAQLNLTMGAIGEARARNQRALAILLAAFGPQHRDVGIVLLQLADTEQVAGNADAALAHIDSARAAFTGLQSNEDGHRARGELIRARALRDSGRLNEAAHIAGEAAAILKSDRGPKHPDTLEAMILQADLAIAAQDLAEAAALAAVVSQAIDEASLQSHPVRISLLQLEVRLAEASGQETLAAEAEARLRALREAREGR